MPTDASPTPSEGTQKGGLTPTSVNIVRLALLAGSVVIGGIFWYLLRAGQLTPSADEQVASIMSTIFYLILATTIGALWVIRQRADKAETFAKRAPLLIVGYAAAEWLTIYGAVYLVMTGVASLFLGGLLVFLIAFAILPIQGPSQE